MCFNISWEFEDTVRYVSHILSHELTIRQGYVPSYEGVIIVAVEIAGVGVRRISIVYVPKEIMIPLETLSWTVAVVPVVYLCHEVHIAIKGLARSCAKGGRKGSRSREAESRRNVVERIEVRARGREGSKNRQYQIQIKELTYVVQ